MLQRQKQNELYNYLDVILCCIVTTRVPASSRDFHSSNNQGGGRTKSDQGQPQSASDAMGMNGLPTMAALRSVKTDRPCLRTVEI